MHPEIGLLAASLQDGTREWREELGEARRDVVAYQAYPGGHSLGALILHIADVEAWWIECVGAGRTLSGEEEAMLLSKETKQYQGQWPVPPREAIGYFFEIHDRIRRRTLETLATFENPEAVVTIKGGKNTFSLRWIVNHVIAHEAYHGGQAVLLKALYERRK